jgi:hypothetical protein
MVTSVSIGVRFREKGLRFFSGASKKTKKRKKKKPLEKRKEKRK